MLARLPRLLPLAALALAAGCAAGPRVVPDYPPAAFKLPAHEVRFDWHIEETTGEEFVGYQLQVSKDEFFRDLIVDRVVPAPRVDLPVEPGRWYWRVRGRYRTLGDRIRETAWSDVHYVAGRFVRRVMAFEALDRAAATAAPAAAAAGGLRAPDAPAVEARAPALGRKGAKQKKRRRRRRADGPGPKVVAAHDMRPALEGIRSISVAQVQANGEASDGLTREVVLRMFALRNIVLLEGTFQRVGTHALRAAPKAAGQDAPAADRVKESRFVLDPGQPTPMLPPGAVRLERPDAVLVVRLYNLDVDPASLPRPPGKAKDRAGFIRFGEGTRVLNATLVGMGTGEVTWTASLYARPGVSDLSLIEELVKRYFR